MAKTWPKLCCAWPGLKEINQGQALVNGFEFWESQSCLEPSCSQSRGFWGQARVLGPSWARPGQAENLYLTLGLAVLCVFDSRPIHIIYICNSRPNCDLYALDSQPSHDQLYLTLGLAMTGCI